MPISSLRRPKSIVGLLGTVVFSFWVTGWLMGICTFTKLMDAAKVVDVHSTSAIAAKCQHEGFG